MQKAIRGLLDSVQAVHVRQVAGAIRRGGRIVAATQPGVSDILACVPYRVAELSEMGIEKVGVFCAIETKAPGWRPPGEKAKNRRHYEQQAAFMAAVHRSGGFGCFAQGIDDVMESLRIRGRFLF